MIINVSEITGDDGYAFTSLTRQKEKVYSYNSQFPKNMSNSHQTFLLILLYGNPVHIVLEFEYSGDKFFSHSLPLKIQGKIALPFWIKDLAKTVDK